MLSIQIGVAKVNKYASRESGDTFELVERAGEAGGLTAVLVDGQGSGRSAKSISNFVAGHCVTLLKQGVRDGVVARAANDQLRIFKGGQVSATLNLLSADFASRSIVITRNSPLPVYIGETLIQYDPGGNPNGIVSLITALEDLSAPLGIYPHPRPVIVELELKPGLVVLAFTDGISNAGERYGQGEKLDLPSLLKTRLPVAAGGTQKLADELLEIALKADQRRPQDDMSVVVLTTHHLPVEDGTAVPRRMSVEITI